MDFRVLDAVVISACLLCVARAETDILAATHILRSSTYGEGDAFRKGSYGVSARCNGAVTVCSRSA